MKVVVHTYVLSSYVMVVWSRGVVTEGSYYCISRLSMWLRTD